ncbi:MAG: branched-chain amino acid ABC transporter permease [Pigmentiphaga sp.]|nr:branched-chain amino acid ABC transporter permease [Pigmentiphaga sp.]
MLEILVSGLIVGAAYAALGLGVTLVAKMSGVVSFAQAAVALLGSYTGLVAGTAFRLPPLLALLVGLLAGAAVGALFGWIIARWFQGADVRIRSSATIALMIGGLTVGARIFGDTPREAPSLLGGHTLALGGVTLDSGLLAALAVSVCLAVALDLALHRTHGGTRLQAYAERPVTAELIGIPAQRLTVLVWGVAGAISALAMHVVMSATARNANFMALSLLIIPALCASLIGRFQSFYLTLLGGLGLGILEALLLSIPDVAPYAQAVYLPVIMALLLWTHRKEVWDGQRG